MSRSGFLIALLLAGSLLCACSVLFGVALFNNSGENIEVIWSGENRSIASSRYARFEYAERMEQHEFRLSSGGCEYLYSIPLKIKDYDFGVFDRGIQVQVERDFSINLLPVDYAGDTPASSAMFLQREGFPLQPVSRKCR